MMHFPDLPSGLNSLFFLLLRVLSALPADSPRLQPSRKWPQLQRFTFCRLCPFLGSICIQYLVHPEVKEQFFLSLQVGPVPELLRAWLRPSLRLYYSPVSPSTQSYFLSFPSFQSADPLAIIHTSSSQSTHSQQNIYDTSKVKFSKPTFSFLNENAFQKPQNAYIFLSHCLCLLSFL